MDTFFLVELSLIILVLIGLLGMCYFMHQRIRLLKDLNAIDRKMNDIKFDHANKMFDAISERLDLVSQRVDVVGHRVNCIYETLNGRLNSHADMLKIHNEDLAELFNKTRHLESQRLLIVDRLGTCEMRGDDHRDHINEVNNDLSLLASIIKAQRLNIIKLDGHEIAKTKQTKSKKRIKSKA